MHGRKPDRVVERLWRPMCERKEKEIKKESSQYVDQFIGVSLEEVREKERYREQNKSNQGIFRRDVWPKSISTPSFAHSAPSRHNISRTQ